MLSASPTLSPARAPSPTPSGSPRPYAQSLFLRHHPRASTLQPPFSFLSTTTQPSPALAGPMSTTLLILPLPQLFHHRQPPLSSRPFELPCQPRPRPFSVPTSLTSGQGAFCSTSGCSELAQPQVASSCPSQPATAASVLSVASSWPATRHSLKPLSLILRNFHLSDLTAKLSPFSPDIQKVERCNHIFSNVMTLRCLSSSSAASSALAEALLEYERDQLYDDEKVIEKEETLRLALSQLSGDFDRESRLSVHRFFRTRYTPTISTGSLKLDLALGIGGLPKGRMVEIYGREASGKTTLALHVVKEAQKLGGCCVYLDVENAMDLSFANGMGVNSKDLLIVHPNSAENSLSIVNTLVNSGSVDVVVVDSVAALVPQCELAGEININSQDMQSQLMNQGIRKIHSSLSRSQTLVIFVNQIRTNLRTGGDIGQINEVTCGGNALKFYSAIRMRITRRNLLHSEDKITGIGISVQVMKNKLARPMKTADLDIEFGRGLRHEAEVLEMASKHGIVMREGDRYWINGAFFRSQIEAEEYLKTRNCAIDELVTALRNQLFEMTPKDE